MNAKMATRFAVLILAASLIAGCVQQGVDLPQETQVETQSIPSEPSQPVPTEEIVPTETTEPPAPRNTSVVFVGADGNLWLVDAVTLQQTQITQDAGPRDNPDIAVAYSFPQWSSDGVMLAFLRRVGTGTSGTTSLWVYDSALQQTRVVLQDTLIAGFSWRPGFNQIAYAFGFDPAAGLPTGERATGIMQVDVDSGATAVLVQPERGYQLIMPVWSENARILTFLELFEGGKTGYFAFYDFTDQAYTSWEVPVGTYSLFPDGTFVVFDNWYEAPAATTAIHIQPIQGGEDRQLSPDIQDGFSFSPVFSPDATQIAYLADLDSSGDMVTLYVMDVSGAQLRELGVFQNGSDLQWTMDSSHLILSRGPYDATEIILINTADGSVTVLATGRQPDVNPALPIW